MSLPVMRAVRFFLSQGRHRFPLNLPWPEFSLLYALNDVVGKHFMEGPTRHLEVLDVWIQEAQQ